MKTRVQEEMYKEYEDTKDQYSSYLDFIQKTAADNPTIQEFRKKLSR